MNPHDDVTAPPGLEAHTSEPGHGGGIELVTPIFGNDGKTGLVWLFINFAVLLFILDRVLFRPLRARQAERHGTLKAELERASAALGEANRVKDELRGRLDRLDAEAQEILDDAKRRAELERKTIVAEAEREAARIREAAEASAARDAELRRRTIEAEVLERAVTRAETLLRERFTPADQHRLLDAYVGGLEALDLREGGARRPAARQGDRT